MISFEFDGKRWEGWSAEDALAAGVPAEIIAAAELAGMRDQMWCTPRQGRLALLAAGHLDTLEAWVAAQPRAVQIEYESATIWRRDWPVVTAGQAVLGLSDAEVDALFAAAVQL